MARLAVRIEGRQTAPTEKRQQNATLEPEAGRHDVMQGQPSTSIDATTPAVTPNDEAADGIKTAQKKGSKRRVLNQRQHNPLLLPLNVRSQEAEKEMASASFRETLSEPRRQPVRATGRRTRADKKPIPAPAELSGDESDSDDASDSNSLSDFIVSDSESIEENEPSPPRRPRRRLVRGVRPRGEEAEQMVTSAKDLNIPPNISLAKSAATDDLAESLGKLDIKDTHTFENDTGLEDPQTVLRFSPPPTRGPSRSIPKPRFVTPPSSPSKTDRKLLSPKKQPGIPATPHRPSMDAFWSQEIVDEWNDEYSPRKETRSPVKDFADGDLTSLSPKKLDKALAAQKKEFAATKNNLAARFLAELDEKITDGQIGKLTASTGGVKIEWSRKLNTTAGRAHWKRQTQRILTGDGSDPSRCVVISHHVASIELAEKVIDDQDRLLNVLAHEFCHLATFIVSGVRDNPHGREFKEWAARCSREFGRRGIEVTTRHAYEIDFKYEWACTDCGIRYSRHSKSIDPARHKCGSCRGYLKQVKPPPRGDAGAGGGKVSEYQLFVKENMKRIKEEHPRSPQKEIMTILGQEYREQKAAKQKAGMGNATMPALAREDSSDGSQVKAVARKLDFVDLVDE